jgi:photosystem II stability/assembly factor-like uncharacterized protein
VTRFCRFTLIAVILIVTTSMAFRAGRAQSTDASLFSGLQWRLVGPFRGGRSLAVAGVASQPDVFYFGAVGGGIWKSTDAGNVWKPVFDGQPLASVGALAVAPSDPRVIYAGMGEADMRSDISYGNGIFKSTDGGKHWTFCGLRDSEQIGRILIDPRDSNRVFVAALGHAYGPNAERGVFRSVDGGQTWRKILYKDENTGAIDIAFGSADGKTLFAALWQTRRPPWNVYPPSNGPGSGLYRSSDGGDTWQPVTGHGFPSDGLGRIGISVSPANPQRVYAIVDAKLGGLYRSGDGGATWARASNDRRIWQRGWYFGGVTADPHNADVVYVANTSLYRSRDGGKTFEAIKGAPGGDDYHNLWISPQNSNRMILGSDQGVIVSLSAGATWSSWYNQPTGQFYHVITDHRFPYWIYGAQQDSGSMAVASRSVYSTLSGSEWLPIGTGGEAGYVAPDPLRPGLLFGVGFGSTVSRYNMATGEVRTLPPSLAHPGAYRSDWTQPLVFSPHNPHELYFAAQKLFRTLDVGATWKMISGDLTRPASGPTPNLDPATAEDHGPAPPRGVIYTIAPSPLRDGLVWVGTDDGLIQLTRDDGNTWRNVTPAEIGPWSKVTLIEASHFDAATAFAAVDRHRLDDFSPLIYRTRDGGKTWRQISQGIPDGSYVNAVREDPERRGLLFAATETGVFVSFNEGNQWQPLQLNLPRAPVRDLTINGNDLIAATHGRAFWVLDNITPLRQIDASVASQTAWLFKPAEAVRIHAGSFMGTPLPPETPQAPNPVAGAAIDYWLKAAPGPVTLAVYDASGKLVRQFSSADHPSGIDPRTIDIPAYWLPKPKALDATPGMHRFVWDMRYPAAGPPNRRYALFGFGGGPLAPPGDYVVKLSVGGATLTQPLKLQADPRSRASPADLQRQFQMAEQIGADVAKASAASRAALQLQRQLSKLQPQIAANGALKSASRKLTARLQALTGSNPAANPDFAGVGLPTADNSSFRYIALQLSRLASAVESGDAAPTPDAVTALTLDESLLNGALSRWKQILSVDLPGFNAALQQAKLPPVAVPTP